MAHRVSWELHRGPIPDRLKVLHSCDTPTCVNPAHLFIGTQSDNMKDCGAKGRSGKKGERNIMAVLSDVQVRTIRQSGKSYDDLMAEFEVSRSTISSIKTRRTWSHLE